MRRVVTVLVAGAGLTAAGQVPASPDVVADRVLSLTRESVWTPVSATPVRFPTFHPQGIATRVAHLPAGLPTAAAANASASVDATANVSA